MNLFAPKPPNNSAQIAEAQKQTKLAEEEARKAKEQRKLEQEDIVERGQKRRRSAFQRFSLMLQEDPSKLGAG